MKALLILFLIVFIGAALAIAYTAFSPSSTVKGQSPLASDIQVGYEFIQSTTSSVAFVGLNPDYRNSYELNWGAFLLPINPANLDDPVNSNQLAIRINGGGVFDVQRYSFDHNDGVNSWEFFSQTECRVGGISRRPTKLTTVTIGPRSDNHDVLIEAMSTYGSGARPRFIETSCQWRNASDITSIEIVALPQTLFGLPISGTPASVIGPESQFSLDRKNTPIGLHLIQVATATPTLTPVPTTSPTPVPTNTPGPSPTPTETPIPMATSNGTINADADDKQEADNTNPPADGNELLVADFASGVQAYGAWRFTLDATIPSGSTIDSAILEVYTIDNADDVEADFYAEDVASAGALGSSDTDITGLTPLTTATVFWNDTGLGNNVRVSPPDMKAVIQELVDTYGAIAGPITILGAPRNTANNRVLNTEPRNAGGGNEATLVITYTAPASTSGIRNPFGGPMALRNPLGAF